MTIAAPIALYSVAVRERRLPPLIAAGAVTFACFLLPDWQLPELDYLAPSLLYALLYAAPRSPSGGWCANITRS